MTIGMTTTAFYVLFLLPQGDLTMTPRQILGLAILLSLVLLPAGSRADLPGWGIIVREAVYYDCDIHEGYIDFDMQFPIGYTYRVKVWVDNVDGDGPKLVLEDTGPTDGGDVNLTAGFDAPADLPAKPPYTYIIRLYRNQSPLAATSRSGSIGYEPN